MHITSVCILGGLISTFDNEVINLNIVHHMKQLLATCKNRQKSWPVLLQTRCFALLYQTLYEDNAQCIVNCVAIYGLQTLDRHSSHYHCKIKLL
jgi:hypothetical protein